MGLFSLHSSSPGGWEYELPDGRVATPTELAEYHRRKRRLTIYNALIFFGLMPLGLWIGLTFIPTGAARFCYMLAVPALVVVLQAAAEGGFRCPVCGMQIPTSSMTPRYKSSPARLAVLYGRYAWCDGCGTRFEKYPGALFPPESQADETPQEDGEG